MEQHFAAQRHIFDLAILTRMTPSPLACVLPGLDYLASFFLISRQRDFSVVRLHLLIHQCEDALCAGHGHRDRIHLLGDVRDRHVERTIQLQE